MPRTWTPVKLRIVRVAVRTVFAVVALSVIGWLYLGSITIQAPNDGPPLECEPLGKGGPNSYHMKGFPDPEALKRVQSYMDYELDAPRRSDSDTKNAFLKDWKLECQRAREGRRDLLSIIAVVSAAVFLALGSRRPFPGRFTSGESDPPRSKGMPLAAKLWIAQAAVRTVFAAAALSVIGWLYLATPTFQAPDSATLKCAPLGSLDSNGYYMADSDLDDQGWIEHYLNNEVDPTKRFDLSVKKTLVKNWEHSCELVREGRRDLLIIVLVLSATIFLALGSPRPFPKLFKSASMLPDPSTPNDFSPPTLRDSSARTPSDSSPQGETAETDAAAPPESLKPPESPNR